MWQKWFLYVTFLQPKKVSNELSRRRPLLGAEAQRQQQPVISVDTKKKELIGNYKPV